MQREKPLTLVCTERAFSCKDGNGGLITDPQSLLRLWWKHFSTVLQGNVDINTAYRDDVPNSIDDDIGEISPPSHVEVTIMRLKNNKAA